MAYCGKKIMVANFHHFRTSKQFLGALYKKKEPRVLQNFRAVQTWTCHVASSAAADHQLNLVTLHFMSEQRMSHSPKDPEGHGNVCTWPAVPAGQARTDPSDNPSSPAAHGPDHEKGQEQELQSRRAQLIRQHARIKTYK